MRILLLGSGGREHALAWKIKQSPLCEALFIAPGNAGTGLHGENLNLSYNDFESIKASTIEHRIDMVFVGPEDPLVMGIVDFFQNDPQLANISIIGPSKEGAQLEGSKSFAKEFMVENSIPTAAYKSFDKNSLKDGQNYIANCKPPIVLKADGLAAGKGVLIIDNIPEAQQELQKMLEGKFGAASSEVVIEEFLSGLEFSVFVLTDGKNYKILPVAKDYKRIGEGDTGLNTGGMGAISPVSFVDDIMMNKVVDRVVEPTIKGLQKRKIDYRGIIFLGLIEVGGEPYVIEYNCRMGDPETEVVIPRVKNDLLPLLASLKNQKLDEHQLQIEDRAAATIMLVSGGYPEDYEKGKKIQELPPKSDSLFFHAGTKQQNGDILTNGGRVLAITSYGETFSDAITSSLAYAQSIQFEGKYYRTDIGFDL